MNLFTVSLLMITSSLLVALVGMTPAHKAGQLGGITPWRSKNEAVHRFALVGYCFVIGGHAVGVLGGMLLVSAWMGG